MLKYFLITSFSALLLVSCGPKKKEETAYELYWKNTFFPEMVKSFRTYNGYDGVHKKITDDEILIAVFPGLKAGEIPSREVAIEKLSKLAPSRPYAQGFTPPE